MAAQVSRMRRSLRALHASSAASSSLPLRDLCWASAVVCSRSLTRPRKRVRALTDEEVGRIGEYAGRDRTRLLPIIDFVNHYDGIALFSNLNDVPGSPRIVR